MTQALLTSELASAAPSRGIVELKNVHLDFAEKHVLQGISLSVAPQERLVIIGQSGAGKTTILRLILGILKPTTGSVFFGPSEVSQIGRASCRERV
jgi:ABC-type bacteriocin/lantibiotic exporter with double-glycine peptidase domain